MSSAQNCVATLPVSDWFPLITYDDAIRDSQQPLQLEEMTSSNDDKPPTVQQHVSEVTCSPTTNSTTTPEGVKEHEDVHKSTADCDSNVDVCNVAITSNVSPVAGDNATSADGQTTDELEMDCRRLPIDGDAYGEVVENIESYSRPEMMAATGGDDSIGTAEFEDLLRTSKQMILSLSDMNSDEKTPMTSCRLADAEYRMHAALAAAGAAYEFGLSPPGCADVDSTSTDVHEMIQNELMQTLTLL